MLDALKPSNETYEAKLTRLQTEKTIKTNNYKCAEDHHIEMGKLVSEAYLKISAFKRMTNPPQETFDRLQGEYKNCLKSLSEALEEKTDLKQKLSSTQSEITELKLRHRQEQRQLKQGSQEDDSKLVNGDALEEDTPVTTPPHTSPDRLTSAG